MMGSGEKMVSDAVSETRDKFLRYIVATQSIAMGGVFTEKNIGIKRTPQGCIGISPNKMYDMLGEISNKNYNIDDVITT